MRKRTTTEQLNAAITDNLLHITSAEIYHKTTRKTNVIDAETFQESLNFLCESIFKDVVGWHFEYDVKEKQYIAECSRMDGSSDLIVIAYLCANEGVRVEDVDKVLRVIEY